MSTVVEIYTFVPCDRTKGWKKRSVFAWVGGELYIPAAATGLSDETALYCLAYDNYSTVRAGDVLLVPEEWARRERPANSAIYDEIRTFALKARESGDFIDVPRIDPLKAQLARLDKARERRIRKRRISKRSTRRWFQKQNILNHFSQRNKTEATQPPHTL